MKTVVIGGGHGAAASLSAALLYADDVAGIITTADDGGSSGRLSEELGVPPMGDIRNCLAALASPSPIVQIFQHRFGAGKLAGHVVGNLIIAGAMKEGLSFPEAIEQAARMIGSRGIVVPSTLDSVRLIANISGDLVEGQVAVATASGNIRFVALDPPKPKAYAPAVDLIKNANHIILGPGSLFTSVLPCLLVPDIRDAILATKAKRVYVANLVASRETEGFDAASHVEAICRHVGAGCVDSVVISKSSRVPAGTFDGVEVVNADVATEDGLRHDPQLLSEYLRMIG